MIQEVEVKIIPRNINNSNLLLQEVAKALGVKPAKITDLKISKRSIDARQKQIYYRLRVIVGIQEKIQGEAPILDQLQQVESSVEVIIVGAGPAGYFAALELIELGLKPIVLDRGKDVQTRRRDLRAIQQFGEVNPHSNYCFGEGGAGTYSDGKLYTRSHKRGKIKKALQLLVEHGAKSDILIDAHPHIGSNKLPKIITNIRATIEQYGGEVHFNSFVSDLIIQNNVIKGVIVNDKTEFLAKAVILATGHSARDIFYLLHKKGVQLETKPFALGVRAEHPQSLVDKIQYRQGKREDNLPAASYKLVCQVKNRGVFSFCMCPGGLVVPAATAPGEIVVNGMSLSRRDSPFANSGIVVAIELEDLKEYEHFGVFAGLEFQKAVEQNMFNVGDGSQKAPAQRLTDFIKGKESTTLNPSSYIPGLFSASLHQLLPSKITRRLREGFTHFGEKMKGYYTEEANLIGTESRTSSPIKIPREKDTYMSPQVKGLFPCGEGGGYAGGIISAAMDGQNVARAVAQFYSNTKMI